MTTPGVPTTTAPRGFLGAVRRWSRARWVRWTASLILTWVIVWWLYNQLPAFWGGMQQLSSLSIPWMLACAGTAYLTFLSAAMVQRTLLSSAGVERSVHDNVAVVLAATAWSVTVPGGQAFATAFTYRETRRWGASPIVASWQLVTSGIFATVGLALLGLTGFFVVGTQSNPVVLGLSILALAALLWATRWAVRNSETLEAFIIRRLRGWNRRRRHPRDRGVHRVREIIGQLDVVDLRRRDIGWTFTWSILNWVTDVACVGLAALAVGAHPSVGALMIAYVTGKLMSTVQVTPGGLGQVEGALIFGLTTLGGLPAHDAFAVVIVYRLLSFLLFTIIGWIVFFWRFQGRKPDIREIDADLPGDAGEDSPENPRTPRAPGTAGAPDRGDAP